MVSIANVMADHVRISNEMHESDLCNCWDAMRLLRLQPEAYLEIFKDFVKTIPDIFAENGIGL